MITVRKFSKTHIMSMGERLKTARIAAGFKTAREAADAMGVSKSTYTAHENGQNEFRVAEAKEYARKFNASPVTIMFGPEYDPNSSQTYEKPNADLATLADVFGIEDDDGLKGILEELERFKQEAASNPKDTPDNLKAQNIRNIARGVNLFLAKKKKKISVKEYINIVFSIYELYPESESVSELVQILETLTPDR